MMEKVYLTIFNMKLLILLIFFPFISFGQKISALPTSSSVDDSTYVIGQQSTLGVFGLALKIPFWQIKASIPSSNNFVVKTPLVKTSGGINPDTISEIEPGLKRTLQVNNSSDTGFKLGKSTGLYPYSSFVTTVDRYGKVTITLADTGAPSPQVKVFIKPDSIFEVLMPVYIQSLNGQGSPPSFSFSATAGTTTLDSVVGTDSWGWFSIEAGTGMTAGVNSFMYITFNTKTRSPSYITITPRNDAAALIWGRDKVFLYSTGSTTSTATISTTDTTPFNIGQHYSYYYDIRGYKP